MLLLLTWTTLFYLDNSYLKKALLLGCSQDHCHEEIRLAVQMQALVST